jgi:ABC-type antimicrobial peptide transport system permease subunit
MLSAFGATAVLLAAVGIYGLLAFLVGLSRREIAIRMALGATNQNVRRRVVAQGAALAAAGMVVGSLGAVLASRVLATQLYGVTGRDPVTFAVVLAIMAIVAFAASYLPARRAAAVDPQLALSAD